MMKEAPQLSFSGLEIREQGGLSASRSLEPEALASLGAGAELAGPVALDLEFSVGGSQILLLGTARGAWRVECGRCLAAVEAPFADSLDATYPLEAETIDVWEEVRESLLLSVPFKPLCRADCRGLCPRCRRNLNEGPCGCPPERPEGTIRPRITPPKKKQG